MNAELLAAAQAYCTPFYMQPERAYHNLTHIQNMLSALETRRVLTSALALAVWGHDLIYDPQRHDNEEQSADIFDDWLSTASTPSELRQEVRALILATRHTSPPSTRPEALLIDADLSILGAPALAFWQYERAIRQEYGFVAWPAYRTGRTAVLQGFLSRDRIYSTPEFAELEAGARVNLEAALARLRERDSEDQPDA
ncbi:phosphohydrolase [Deinococcus sp. KNUC1210]|uniref:HD domain-containing protein n=1 Tax=Deinococcus sp. KNUC1210 TaxID=2917691 RepID=UPI001EF1403C|nr:phosphohydrolase [Deinococcus sp. KNUC1210]ULH15266.1 phosphohydrolase [Deinococcus sp. KNUC1210]